MSVPTSLFVDSPELQDVSLHSLEEDSDSWPETITQKLKERIPVTAGMSTIVKLMKKDDENGAATGSIVVSNDKKQAIVPVIIKDFNMFPLDIFIAKGKLLPLTLRYFQEAFSDNESFSSLEEFPMYGGIGRFDEGSLWNANYPPSLGRYAYASAGYPILDFISDDLDTEKFSDYLRDNHDIAINFQKNGQADIIKKLASLQPVNMNEFRQGKDKLINKNIAMLRKEGPNKYNLLANSDTIFSPTLFKSQSRDDIHKTISCISDSVSDDMHEVDCNGEKLIVAKEIRAENGRIHIEEAPSEAIESANEFGLFSVKNDNGVSFKGHVIPTVIDFNMEKLPLKVFLGKEMSAIQENIVGIRLDNPCLSLPKSEICTGQTGTFVYMPDQKRAMATVPVTITSMTTCEHSGIVSVMCKDMHGLSFHVEFCDFNLERIAKIGSGYKIPKDKFNWVPMDGFQRLTSNIESYSLKTAGEKLTSSPVKLLPTGYNQYALKGVEKYASVLGWDSSNLGRSQTEFLLASLGMDPQRFDGLFKGASVMGRATIHGLNRPQLVSEKVAEALPLAREISKIAKELNSNLIKEASFMDSSQTVDSLLSLNFITPDNIQKFVSKLPLLKSSISQLGSLLMAARLGIKEIPEQAVTTAITRMVEVVDGLEALRATQEG